MKKMICPQGMTAADSQIIAVRGGFVYREKG